MRKVELLIDCWYQEFRGYLFYSPQDLYNEGGYPSIESDTEEKAKLLKSLGINLNLAPVADISTNPYDFIYYRTFGKDAVETSKYVETVVKVMKEQKYRLYFKALSRLWK